MKKILKFTLYAALGFIVLIIGVGTFVPSSKNAGGSGGPNSASSPPVKESSVEPRDEAQNAIRITAVALQSAYEKNEVSADQAYKGKSLLVSGTIQSIDKDAFNNIVIQLRSGNEFTPAHAYLGDEHETLAASLNKGQKVTFRCTGDGLLIGSPILRECQPA